MPLTNTQKTLSTTASKLVGAGGSPCKIIIHNEAGKNVYIGGSSAVTASNGFHIASHEMFDIDLMPGNELWAICESGTGDVVVLAQQL